MAIDRSDHAETKLLVESLQVQLRPRHPRWKWRKNWAAKEERVKVLEKEQEVAQGSKRHETMNKFLLLTEKQLESNAALEEAELNLLQLRQIQKRLGTILCKHATKTLPYKTNNSE